MQKSAVVVYDQCSKNFIKDGDLRIYCLGKDIIFNKE